MPLLTYKDTINILKHKLSLLEVSIEQENVIEIESELESTVREVMGKIIHLNSYELSQEYFEVLDNLQFVSANLLFKYKICMSDYLDKFTRDFDRVDNSEHRLHLYNQIILGRYN